MKLGYGNALPASTQILLTRPPFTMGFIEVCSADFPDLRCVCANVSNCDSLAVEDQFEHSDDPFDITFGC